MQFDIRGAPLVFRDVSTNAFLESAFQIRWSALTPECVAPAIDIALERAQANLAAIIALEPGALTYENTFLALENATEELNRAWGKVTAGDFF